ncbi:DUF5671 domain-containing protein [Lysobacter sp. 5GHs7-4]|uniref:DUF5671 domain-containing protein n=1 Tax=Lysobacter sp. 5GHs7-4 TaxID=2904253 RepID=UPI001E56CF67|nr:DUF5671 domain-containing protein [Lysobacter sp. 5GHs7-4]UHQ21683.1 DUF5671 domain-containing protein [Lysobacter sp. 5GHs7-4]
MAAGTQELELFVREALMRGQSKEAIAQALGKAGWTAEQTRGMLDAYADVGFVVPVPKPRASLSAREAFLYLVLFATLYFVAFSLGSLLFDLINRMWPDAASGYDASAAILGPSMRWSVAALTIAFPVFAFVSAYLAREVALHPIKRLSPVRRWLTYLTLFVAASVLIGDMTVLVYNLLGGELSVRFVLKVLVVATIAGTAFGYYLRDLRREEVEGAGGRPVGRGLLVSTAAVIVAASVAAIVTTGGPAVQREQRLDARRVQDLTRITYVVNNYVRQHDRLPPDLKALAAQPGMNLSIVDPVDGTPYVYRAGEDLDYQLCARFVTDTASDEDEYGSDSDWLHDVGEHCFDREAKP